MAVSEGGALLACWRRCPERAVAGEHFQLQFPQFKSWYVSWSLFPVTAASSGFLVAWSLGVCCQRIGGPV